MVRRVLTKDGQIVGAGSGWRTRIAARGGCSSSPRTRPSPPSRANLARDSLVILRFVLLSFAAQAVATDFPQ